MRCGERARDPGPPATASKWPTTYPALSPFVNNLLVGGADFVSTGEGDDTVSAQDGAVDRVSCGVGSDTITADFADVLDACAWFDAWATVVSTDSWGTVVSTELVMNQAPRARCS